MCKRAALLDGSSIAQLRSLSYWARSRIARSSLPIGGAISERIGRKPLLLTISVLAIFTAYPALSWLAYAPSFARMLTVLLWSSFFFGMYNGATVAALTDVMPVEVRVAGFSLAFSLATAVLERFTAAASTYLIQATHDKAAPAYWLSFAAFCGGRSGVAERERRANARSTSRERPTDFSGA